MSLHVWFQPGRVQSKPTASEWMKEHPQPRLPPWANPPPWPDSCLKLEAFPLKEQVKFLFPSHRNRDRHKCFGGFISDSLLEQLGSVRVGFTANVLEVKQAPVQPLLARGYCLPHTFCCGQADGERQENKTCPCNTPRGRAATAELPSFIHCRCHFTLMWLLSCPWGELIFPHITSMSNQVQVEIPLVMDNCKDGKVRKLPTPQKNMCPCTYHPFIHAVTYIIHHEESLQVPLVVLSRQNPLLFAQLFLK